jgi:hypothetical protein
MRVAKAGRHLIDFIELCYRAKRPLLLIGTHGIGKSELLEQAANKVGIGFICRDLSLMEPPDLVGMPQLDGKVTRYLPPAFLPTGGRGLLVFEELNRCPSYMRAPCLQLLTARTLNDYQLPGGWLPAAAINPSDADYDTQDLDEALLSRFTRVHVVADRKEWLSWAETAGVHQDVLAYVAHHQTIFQSGPMSNPRAWKAASDLLLAAGRVAPRTLALALDGTVGPELATAFCAFRTRGGATLPEASELLSDYGRHRRRVLACVREGRTDILSQAVFSLELLLQTTDSYASVRKDKEQSRNLERFLKDLPPDLAQDVCAFLEDHHGDGAQPRRSS